MIVDTSAIVAIAWDEPERHTFVRALTRSTRRLVSAVSLVETHMVIDGARRAGGLRQFDDVLADLHLTIVPFDAEQARVARHAFLDFGRGSGHPARLNFGDCLAYAAAKVTGEPLLFKGDDFTHTDIRPAV